MTETSNTEGEEEVESRHAPEFPRVHPHTTLDSHRTLWMGDLLPQWDATFISNAFKVIRDHFVVVYS